MEQTGRLNKSVYQMERGGLCDRGGEKSRQIVQVLTYRESKDCRISVNENLHTCVYWWTDAYTNAAKQTKEQQIILQQVEANYSLVK